MRLLVIEDLQWLDPSSEELLRHLTLEARSLRLMLLMTRACRWCGTRLELGGRSGDPARAARK